MRAVLESFLVSEGIQSSGVVDSRLSETKIANSGRKQKYGKISQITNI